MAENGYTTIPVRFKTKERIANICLKSKTYDEHVSESPDGVGTHKRVREK